MAKKVTMDELNRQYSALNTALYSLEETMSTLEEIPTLLKEFRAVPVPAADLAQFRDASALCRAAGKALFKSMTKRGKEISRDAKKVEKAGL